MSRKQISFTAVFNVLVEKKFFQSSCVQCRLNIFVFFLFFSTPLAPSMLFFSLHTDQQSSSEDCSPFSLHPGKQVCSFSPFQHDAVSFPYMLCLCKSPISFHTVKSQSLTEKGSGLVQWFVTDIHFYPSKMACVTLCNGGSPLLKPRANVRL